MKKLAKMRFGRLIAVRPTEVLKLEKVAQWYGSAFVTEEPSRFPAAGSYTPEKQVLRLSEERSPCGAEWPRTYRSCRPGV